MKKIISIAASAAFSLALLFAGNSAYAQTGTTPGTVGAPNTGAGGEAAMNVGILVASGAIVVGGAAYLLREKKLSVR